MLSILNTRYGNLDNSLSFNVCNFCWENFLKNGMFGESWIHQCWNYIVQVRAYRQNNARLCFTPGCKDYLDLQVLSTSYVDLKASVPEFAHMERKSNGRQGHFFSSHPLNCLSRWLNYWSAIFFQSGFLIPLFERIISSSEIKEHWCP